MRITKTFHILVAASALLLTGMMGEVLAGDAKGYPGWMCQANANGPGTLVYLSNGGVANSHTSETLSVRCPIIRDNTSTNNWRMAEAFYTNKNPNQLMSCTMTAWGGKYHRGSSTEYSNERSTRGRMYIQRLEDTYSATTDIYFLTCEMPPKTSSGQSELSHYRLTEK